MKELHEKECLMFGIVKGAVDSNKDNAPYIVRLDIIEDHTFIYKPRVFKSEEEAKKFAEDLEGIENDLVLFYVPNCWDAAMIGTKDEVLGESFGNLTDMNCYSWVIISKL